MPIAFYKCECGEEQRQVVPFDRSGSTKNPRTGNWEWDPKRKDEKLPPRFVTCICGKKVGESPDPKGVKTKLLFNYMED